MSFVHIAGNLGADPEVRVTAKGQKVTTLRVASRTRKGGKDETIWWRVTVWGDHLDKMISFLKKGSSVMVFGEMEKPEIFTDREGKPQISLNIRAFHISFSPFGRPGSSEEGGEKAKVTPKEAVTESTLQEPSFAGFEYGAQSSSQSHFADEEIPF